MNPFQVPGSKFQVLENTGNCDIFKFEILHKPALSRALRVEEFFPVPQPETWNLEPWNALPSVPAVRPSGFPAFPPSRLPAGVR
jgi:hypothetical protein